MLTGTLIIALILVPVAILFWPSPVAEKLEPPPLDISFGFNATYVSGVSDTHRFEAEVRDSDVAKHPIWDRSTDNPPVSINNVMVAAQNYRDTLIANKQFPDGSQIIDLKLVPIDSRDHLWFWVVTFRVRQSGNPIEEIEIAVLMDGSVVPHDIHRRIDAGWPLPDAPIAERPDATTDLEILRQFVADLNPSRQHAGLNIELTGILTRIPTGHPDLNTGQYFHFTTDNGIVLICDPPGGWPLRLNQELKISGKLLGYRNLNNREPPWDGLQLFPGIDITSVGVVRD